MHRPSRRHRGTRIALIAVFAATLGVTIAANARERLGPIDNVLLKNPYASPANGKFGSGVVAGDFDGDGTGDLAISEYGGTRLRILLGANFTVGTQHLFTFFPTTVTMPSHSNEMAAGDFDGDGRDEIAVGALYASHNGLLTAGKVFVVNRLGDSTWEVQSEINAGGTYPGSPQASAYFGKSLAAGDFNDDGFDDLAIGISGQSVNNVDNAGAVMVTYGGLFGITPSGARIINRTNDGLNFPPARSDYFGQDVATGDFDGDGDADLAIGISGATCPNGIDRGGAVVVLKGSIANGITNAGSQFWQPGVAGIAGTCEPAAYFGSALATGRFRTRGIGFPNWVDLVVGAPDSGPGAVHVIRGSASGLAVTGNQRVPAPAQWSAGFGQSLAAGVLSSHCANLFCAGDSLAVGAPNATINGTLQAGVAWVFDTASGGGVDASSTRPILPLTPLRITAPHVKDYFARQLAIGDFNGDGSADLAVSAHNYDDGVESDAGAVQVLYQTELIFVDGFE